MATAQALSVTPASPSGQPANRLATSRRIAVPPLNLGRIAREIALITALLLINKLGTPGAIAFFCILGVMLFRSPATAFKALAICYLGLMTNTFFVPKSIAWTPGRLILPLVAFFRFSFDLAQIRSSLFSKPSYLAFVAFVLTMAVCSVLSGWYTTIALTKLTNFWAVITAILSGVMVLRRQRVDLTEWFVALVAVAVLIGAASVVLGVSRNFRVVAAGNEMVLYAGMLNGAFLHPNVHAIYAAQFVTFMVAVWLLGRYRNRWLTLPILGGWLTFMSYSQSRTSVLASATGCAVLFLYARPSRNRLGWLLRPNISRGTLWLLMIMAAGLVGAFDVATSGSISKAVVGFINKGGAAEDASLDTAQILQSRLGLIEMSWKNFQEQPLHGIGFGVAKTEAFARMATLLTAPAEKGFLPTAILEEGGILGATAFVVFVIVFITELWFQKNIAGMAAFATFLISNLGEVTIFSPGGAGSFGWMMIGAAMILGDHCWARPNADTPPAKPPMTRPALF